MVFTALTFGGYSTYQFWGAVWNGYQEDGMLGAVNAVNPLYTIAVGGKDAYEGADKGDYWAAGRSGVKAVVTALVTVVGVVKTVGAVRAASGAAAAGASAGGAPRAYSVAFETKIPKRGIGTYQSHFQSANETLLRSMKDQEMARALRTTLGENFEGTILSNTGRVLERSPSGWTWHHVPDQPGVLQLVPNAQHRAPRYRDLFHPNGFGGMKIWGSHF